MGEGCVLVVAAGDAKIDNGKFKAQFHTKAKMLTPEQVEEFTGHAVGGVCPFAIEDPRTVTYLDVSLKRFGTVYPAAGSDNSAIELTCEELEKYASNFAGWVDVCKAWRPEEQGTLAGDLQPLLRACCFTHLHYTQSRRFPVRRRLSAAPQSVAAFPSLACPSAFQSSRSTRGDCLGFLSKLEGET